MRIFLRKILAPLTNESTRRFLKRAELRFKKKVMAYAGVMQKSDFEKLFRDKFKLRAGDVVMVHAGTSTLKTELSALEIVEILQEVITETGTIVVPTYPRGSVRYLQRKSPFNARTTPSAMGEISEVVRKNTNAFRSTHPVKSIAAVGPKAEMICSGHEQSVYPFGPDSPYKKLYDLGVKVIGIGAPMSYLSFVHVAEDLYPGRARQPIWEPNTYEKICLDMWGNEFLVETRVHNMELMVKANPEKYCRSNLPKQNYEITRRGMAEFFCVDGKVLTDKIADSLKNGVTIYD